jgi:cytochrome c556
MKFTSTLATAVIAAFCVAATVAIAQQNSVEQRQALMKKNNEHAKAMITMIKGEAPHDVAKVNAAFDQWTETAKQFGSLFPPDSKEGDTRATEAVWSQREKFEAAIANFAKNVADQRKKATSGLDGLKAAMSVVGKDCGNCHETFRKPR